MKFITKIRTVRLIYKHGIWITRFWLTPRPPLYASREGEPCHIRFYRHKSPLFRNAREGSPRRSAASA